MGRLVQPGKVNLTGLKITEDDGIVCTLCHNFSCCPKMVGFGQDDHYCTTQVTIFLRQQIYVAMIKQLVIYVRDKEEVVQFGE